MQEFTEYRIFFFYPPSFINNIGFFFLFLFYPFLYYYAPRFSVKVHHRFPRPLIDILLLLLLYSLCDEHTHVPTIIDYSNNISTPYGRGLFTINPYIRKYECDLHFSSLYLLLLHTTHISARTVIGTR